jgi:uncharacterized protein
LDLNLIIYEGADCMQVLTNEIIEAWGQKEGPVVVTTVDKENMPNSVYATCVGMSADHRIVVADNYFSKTKLNIEQGSRVVVLFITEAGKSYQIKGEVEYHTSGVLFDFMKSWNPIKHPGHGAVVVNPLEAYSGKTRIL